MNLIAKLALSAATTILAVSAMADTPKLMIVPSKQWCIAKGYVTRSERNGKEIIREDFDKALMDQDFDIVAKAIKRVFNEKGYRTDDSQQTSENDEFDEMLDEAYEGAQTGSGLQTNAYDQLVKNAKPDITIRLGWKYNDAGGTYNVTYTLEAIDTFSSETVANTDPLSTGVQRKTTPIELAIASVAKDGMDDFCEQMNDYFDDIQENGRKMRARINIVDNGVGVTMNTEFGGTELSEILDNWMNENSLNHQYNLRSSGRNFRSYEKIRVPLRDSRGQINTADNLLRALQKHLKQYGIVAEVSSGGGIGSGRLNIGEK